jgi:cytochrome c oxidase assembly factor CtaG
VRSSSSPRAIAEAPVWRLCCFAGSVLVAVAALVSPIDALADQLFFAHMVQHMLLLDVTPILAILGFTKVILRPVTRSVHELERRAGPLAHPAAAVCFYVGVIWVWHIPSAYDLAVRHSLVHIGEHITFVIAGSLYWWHLLSPIRARKRLGGMGPIVYMAASKLFVGALGMGLAFAPSALYPYYVHHARVWGISAHDDQSIAGLIMAVEQSIVMGAAIVVLFIRMLGESEREQQRAERYELADPPTPSLPTAP